MFIISNASVYFPETAHPIWLAFSAYTNGKSILKISEDPGQILCFNGIKVLSLFWVIHGHRYAFMMFSALNLAYVANVSFPKETRFP